MQEYFIEERVHGVPLSVGFTTHNEQLYLTSVYLDGDQECSISELDEDFATEILERCERYYKETVEE